MPDGILTRNCFAPRRLAFVRGTHAKVERSPALGAADQEPCGSAGGSLEPRTLMAEASAPGNPAVSIVVPVKDEADNIGPLVEEIAAAMSQRWSFEVVYVNDGSSDTTEGELTRLMSERRMPPHCPHCVARLQRPEIPRFANRVPEQRKEQQNRPGDTESVGRR